MNLPNKLTVMRVILIPFFVAALLYDNGSSQTMRVVANVIFIVEMEFERVGVFTYSAEEDTPAYSYPDQIPEEVKEERRADVMELQQEIAFEHCENMVGKVLDVMIEGKVADEPAYVGRTYMDAPNVDGLIFVNADEMLMSGDFVRVKVTGANEYDLIGEVYHESAE